MTVFPTRVFSSVRFSVISGHVKQVLHWFFSENHSSWSLLKSKSAQICRTYGLPFRSSSKTLLTGVAATVLLKPEEQGNGPMIEDISANNTNGSRIFSATHMSETNRNSYQVEKGNYKVIFVLGGPGVGKGTQCSKLSRKFGWIHLSAGDLLRREQSREGSPFTELIATCIQEGSIVPHFVTIALLKAEMELYPHRSIFLIDGFPREVAQAEAFEQTVIPMELVLFFECEEEIMLTRLMHRSQTSGRTDDNIESILKRFRTYQQASIPVISYYEEQGKVKRVGRYFFSQQ